MFDKIRIQTGLNLRQDLDKSTRTALEFISLNAWKLIVSSNQKIYLQTTTLIYLNLTFDILLLEIAGLINWILLPV